MKALNRLSLRACDKVVEVDGPRSKLVKMSSFLCKEVLNYRIAQPLQKTKASDMSDACRSVRVTEQHDFARRCSTARSVLKIEIPTLLVDVQDCRSNTVSSVVT